MHIEIANIAKDLDLRYPLQPLQTLLLQSCLSSARLCVFTADKTFVDIEAKVSEVAVEKRQDAKLQFKVVRLFPRNNYNVTWSWFKDGQRLEIDGTKYNNE